MKIVVIGGTGLIGSKTVAMQGSACCNNEPSQDRFRRGRCLQTGVMKHIGKGTGSRRQT
jgi:hypothetical protein